MSGLVLGWVAVIAIVFAAIARPWKSPLHRAPLPMGLAAAVGLWGLWADGQKYAAMMEQGAWTAATISMVLTPAGILVVMLLAYAFGRAVLAARATAGSGLRRWGFVLALGAALSVMLGYDLFTYRDFVRVQSARSKTLSDDDKAALAARVRSGLAHEAERNAFLENPVCPQDLLEETVRKGDQRSRIAVARNPAVNADLVVVLSRDDDGDVRYYATHSAMLPVSELPRLSADPYELVREATAWKKDLPQSDFKRLITDPHPRVRATVALQPRLDDDGLRVLAADRDETVRRNALRIMGQRGLEAETP